MKNFEIEFLNKLQDIFKAPITLSKFDNEKDCRIHVTELVRVPFGTHTGEGSSVQINFTLEYNSSCDQYYRFYLTDMIINYGNYEFITFNEEVDVPVDGYKNRIGQLTGTYTHILDRKKYTNKKIKDIDMVVKEYE